MPKPKGVEVEIFVTLRYRTLLPADMDHEKMMALGEEEAIGNFVDKNIHMFDIIDVCTG
jgi:hypothetical protein